MTEEDHRVVRIPLQCAFRLDDHERCQSRNAVWVEAFQGNLCMVHEAAYAQARRRHPAGKKAEPHSHGASPCTDPKCGFNR